MARKLTKDIKYVVDEANRVLATAYYQQNEQARKTLTGFIDHLLLQREMYHGFNYFKRNENNEIVLAGETTNLIQYYTC